MFYTSRLSGPPEIYKTTPSSASDGGDHGGTIDDDDDMSRSRSRSRSPMAFTGWENWDGSRIDFTGDPPMDHTENFSPTYLSTTNPCLDLFFHVVPDTSKAYYSTMNGYSYTNPDYLTRILMTCWDYNSLTTLKLICNLRGVQGTGKSDKGNFFKAAFWLHQHHPKTLASNVGVLAEFGSFKDLLDILLGLLQVGRPQVRSIAKKKYCKGRGRIRKMPFPTKENPSARKRRKLEKKNKRMLRAQEPSEQRIKANMEKVNDQREKARVFRKVTALFNAKKAFRRYTHDPEYRFLHDKISELFAEHLRLDIQCLTNGEISKISLAAKWCPSIDSSYDKSTLICESIARRVFPREDCEEYRGIEEAHYVYRVRDRLRKEVLVPLRKALELPEVYMTEKQWDTIPYNRVSSFAMNKYKSIFLQRDNQRFTGYLEDVKNGKAKISADALLPHEIIASLGDADGGKVAELQWARMVEDLAEKRKLRNCIAVCDVSTSMRGTPKAVSVALGLLISELSEDPWKGKVITFGDKPQLHIVQGNSLLKKTKFVKKMESGRNYDRNYDRNCDFQEIFNRILRIAVDGKLSEEQMIKKIFVFSDMEFDQASRQYPYHGYSYWNTEDSFSDSDTDSDADVEERPRHGRYGSSYADVEERPRHGRYGSSYADVEKRYSHGRPRGWKTDYEVIQKKFQRKGYSKVPEMVFWNLRLSKATPVTAKQSGVALVSGFSKNMVTMFMEEDGIVNPEVVMENAISGELYQKLVVYD